MRAYLDDVRNPADNGAFYDIIWRSFNEAVSYCLVLGCPNFISFDHDLGHVSYGFTFKLKPTGMDFAKWLVNEDITNPGFIPKEFNFNVHSLNPVGALNILSYLNQYLHVRHKNEP